MSEKISKNSFFLTHNFEEDLFLQSKEKAIILVCHLRHYASKLEVILIEQAAWRLSHSKDARKPPLLDELTSFGQRESAPAILGLY